MVLQRRVGCGATHKVGLNPELMNDHKYRGALVLGIQSPIRSLWRSRSLGERERRVLWKRPRCDIDGGERWVRRGE